MRLHGRAGLLCVSAAVGDRGAKRPGVPLRRAVPPPCCVAAGRAATGEARGDGSGSQLPDKAASGGDLVSPPHRRPGATKSRTGYEKTATTSTTSRAKTLRSAEKHHRTCRGENL